MMMVPNYGLHQARSLRSRLPLATLAGLAALAASLASSRVHIWYTKATLPPLTPTTTPLKAAWPRQPPTCRMLDIADAIEMMTIGYIRHLQEGR